MLATPTLTREMYYCTRAALYDCIRENTLTGLISTVIIILTAQNILFWMEGGFGLGDTEIDDEKLSSAVFS